MAEGAKLVVLLRLSRYCDEDGNDQSDPDAVFGAMFPGEKRYSASSFWNEGEDPADAPADDPAFVEAFVEGAMEVLNEARSKSDKLR